MKKILLCLITVLLISCKTLTASINDDIEIKFIQLKSESRSNNVDIIEHDSVDISDIAKGYRGDFAIYEVDGHHTFCVEPLTNTYSIAPEINYEDTDYYDFNDDVKEDLGEYALISEQLYNYYDDNQYLYAGQLLIWDIIKPNTFDTSIDEFSVEIAIIEEYKQALDNLETGITLKYNESTKRYEATISNIFLTNEIFSEVVETSSEVEYEIIDNQIVLYTNDIFTKNKEIKFDIVSEDKVIYYDAGQELKAFKYQYSQYAIPIDIDAEYGGLKLIKLGENIHEENVALEGVEFKVTKTTDENYEKIFKTDKDGIIETEIDALPVGEYTIEEIKAAGKYDMNYKEEFTIYNNTIASINDGQPIVNKLKEVNLYFYKYGEDNISDSDNHIGLDNVEFSLYKDIDNNEKFDSDIDIEVANATSNKIGEVTFQDVKYDQYFIVETAVNNDDYLLSEEVKFIDLENYSGEKDYYLSEEYDFYNSYKKGQLNFVKIGTINGENIVLEGSKFVIYQDINNNKIIDKNDLLIQDAISDDDGTVSFTNLKYGSYIIKEVVPTEGYQLNNQEIIVEITQEYNTIDEENEFFNKFEYNSLIINKTDKDSKEGLSGAEFYLYQINEDGEQNITFNNKEYQVTRILLSETILTVDGQYVVSNLLPGEYLIKEINPPFGYKLDEDSIQYIKIPEEKGVLNFENEIIYKEIVINKIDEKTNQELAGAQLEIRDKNNNLITDLTTTLDEDSISLIYGKYQLCETKAPEGYQLKEECMSFTVDEDNDEITFSNEKITIKSISEAGFDNNILAIGATVLSIVIIVVIRKVLTK